MLDILSELPYEIGYKYDYWAQRSSSGSYMFLPSPTCVVPVIGTMIYLYLERSESQLYIPSGQAFLYSDCSRSELYTAQSYASASKQIKMTRPSQPPPININLNINRNQQQQQQRSNSEYEKFTKKKSSC